MTVRATQACELAQRMEAKANCNRPGVTGILIPRYLCTYQQANVLLEYSLGSLSLSTTLKTTPGGTLACLIAAQCLIKAQVGKFVKK